jgi:hypothetical protein
LTTINGALLNKPGARKCKYCGELLPKKRKAYCDITCLRLRKDQERIETPTHKQCTKCKEVQPNTADYFYWRKNPVRLDTICKACRRLGVKLSKERDAAKTKTGEVILSPDARTAEGRERATPDGFRIYMERNPHYFETMFRMPATPENISAVYRAASGGKKSNRVL